MSTISNKEQITYLEYLDITNKLDIRFGQIIEAERIPKSSKLVKLTVIFGELTDPSREQRTVVTSLGDSFDTEIFIGLICPFVMNLVHSKPMGVTSEAMIMVGEDKDGKISLDKYKIGSKLL